MRTPKPKAWLCNYSSYMPNIHIHGLRPALLGESIALEYFALEKKESLKTITEQEKHRFHEEILNALIAINNRWEAGEYLEPEIMPRRLYRYPGEKLPKPHEQIFRIMNGFLVVSQAVYDVMQQFRLGQTHFSQVYIYDIKKPEKLLSETPYYFINIAEKRHFMDVEQSQNICEASWSKPDNPKYRIGEVEDKDIHLFAAAKDCDVDLWHDPYLDESLFMSDRLVQALLDSGIKKGKLALKQCVIREP